MNRDGKEVTDANAKHYKDQRHIYITFRGVINTSIIFLDHSYLGADKTFC